MKMCDCKVCNWLKSFLTKAAKLDLALLGLGLASLGAIVGTVVPKKCHKHARCAMGALIGFSGVALGAKMLVSFLKNR
jgi:hypothetical protein